MQVIASRFTAIRLLIDGVRTAFVAGVFRKKTFRPSMVAAIAAPLLQCVGPTWQCPVEQRGHQCRISYSKRRTEWGNVKSRQLCLQVSTASFVMVGIVWSSISVASADDLVVDPSAPGPVHVASAPTADNADPTAVAACSQFATVLDGSSSYYGDFADSFEGSSYSDPAVSSNNVTGRTALRESAALAMKAADTPGLSPDIAQPMRAWSLGATKLLVKMGLRMSGDGLNTTATEMNNRAAQVQEACAAAGTHA